DHAIELLPDSMSSSCKVYPLVPREQDELNAFLQENLDSSCICPSKSPMASPVFFFKKKDGETSGGVTGMVCRRNLLCRQLGLGPPPSTPVCSTSLSVQSSHAAAAAVTLGGIIIKEKDPKDKGKGKATEEKEMEVNATYVSLPEDKFLDEELQNLLKSPKAPTKEAN
ncbi:hypothetical protein J132_09577, partial [Termitomyces sp. J132]